eukprot:TRINITY_DN6155_c0_g1_i1.p1 TRINITY_DN6155_c0_g1~~TRINITY_DN6155_c0_g1_i1.p1  ORF type:complete len:305 (+),score=67.90 TRINITY_DN6155_c0_g1_i1:100-915(+)
MKETIGKVNTVIEVRDARLPLSSANPLLKEVATNKHKVVVMTHYDLCNKNMAPEFQKYIERTEKASVIHIDAVHLPDNWLTTLCETCFLSTAITSKQVWLILGMPNVGKSTLINALVGEGKAPTSSVPGFTRGQTFYQLRDTHNKDLDVLLFDTPGVMVPGLLEPTTGLSLALCGIIESQKVPGEDETLAEYLFDLYKERNRLHVFKKMLDIPKDVELLFVEQLVPYVKKKHGKDGLQAYSFVVNLFKQGKLGPMTLDILPDSKLDERQNE